MPCKIQPWECLLAASLVAQHWRIMTAYRLAIAIQYSCHASTSKPTFLYLYTAPSLTWRSPHASRPFHYHWTLQQIRWNFCRYTLSTYIIWRTERPLLSKWSCQRRRRITRRDADTKVRSLCSVQATEFGRYVIITNLHITIKFQISAAARRIYESYSQKIPGALP